MMFYLSVFALFHFVFGGNFQVETPRGSSSAGKFNTVFFIDTSIGALSSVGYIHGVANFRNFTAASHLD